MFLPSGWLMPVLPPTDESTWAAMSWDLDEGHAALVDGCREPRDIADDAAPQCQERRRTLRLLLEEPRQHVLQRRPRLEGFAVGNDDRLAPDPGRGEALNQRRKPERSDDRIRQYDDSRLREQRREGASPALREPGADVDRHASFAERGSELLCFLRCGPEACFSARILT